MTTLYQVLMLLEKNTWKIKNAKYNDLGDMVYRFQLT